MFIGQALPKEIERVQELIKVHERVENGRYAVVSMRIAVANGIKAMVSGDRVGMLSLYEKLRSFE